MSLVCGSGGSRTFEKRELGKEGAEDNVSM